MFSWQKQHLTREMLFLPLEHKIHIFDPRRLTTFGSSTMARNDVIDILTSEDMENTQLRFRM